MNLGSDFNKETTTLPDGTLFPAVNEFQKAVDDFADQLKEEWTGSIPFAVTPVFNASLYPSLDSPSKLDICSFLGTYSIYKRLYFSSQVYPPPNSPNSAFSNSTYLQLKKDLETAAFEAGSPIISNGGSKAFRLYKCCLSRRRAENKVRAALKELNKTPLCDSCLVNDAKCSRSNGRSMSRKTSCAAHDIACPFGLYVYFDNHGYYVSLEKNGGCCIHKFHPKIDPFELPLRTHLLSKSTRKDIRHMGEACCGAGTGRNFVYSKFLCYLPNTKIAYLFDGDDNGTTGTEKGQGTDIDSLLCFFESTDDIAYQVLWDVPTHTLVNQSSDSLSAPDVNLAPPPTTTNSPLSKLIQLYY